jgi:hypothetical protein
LTSEPLGELMLGGLAITDGEPSLGENSMVMKYYVVD